MALGLAQLWHCIYDFQLVWDMGGKHTRIMAGKDKSWRYFTLKIPQMEHGFQSQQLHSAHCSNRYITLFILELRWLTSALFRCARQKKAVRRRSTTHNSIFFTLSSGLPVNLFAASSTTLHSCCVFRAFTEVRL